MANIFYLNVCLIFIHTHGNIQIKHNYLLSSAPTMGFYYDTEAVAIQGSNHELSLLNSILLQTM